MKALILSGGKGTRLRPITHTNAKQLVPIANKPILFYAIESIVKAGIKDIGIIVGDTHQEIKNVVGEGAHWGVRISYIYQESPLGLAHAVKISQNFLNNEEFVMFLGDNLIKDGIQMLVKEFQEKKPNAQILLAEVPRPEQFGVAVLKDGKVVKLVEKPDKPISNYALVGVYMFDKNIFEAVKAIKPSARGELEITDAIQYLVDHKFNVRPYIITGWWKDTGKLEDMLEANRIVLDTLEKRIEGKVDDKSRIEGKVVVEKGANIINSVIRGPVIIGENTEIIDSYVGPFTSIYHNVSVIDTEIEHSIVLENSKICNIQRIADSLIGQNVEVKKTQTKPAVYRIMVGDSSRVEVV